MFTSMRTDSVSPALMLCRKWRNRSCAPDVLGFFADFPELAWRRCSGAGVLGAEDGEVLGGVVCGLLLNATGSAFVAEGVVFVFVLPVAFLATTFGRAPFTGVLEIVPMLLLPPALEVGLALEGLALEELLGAVAVVAAASSVLWAKRV